jgi:HD-like signal output (HDOD) protein
MADKPTNWIEDFADLQLPALANSKKQLDQALSRPATDYALLAQILGRDPGLLTRLYQKLASSAEHLRGSISDPARIISLLGLGTVQQLANTTPRLEERFKGPALQGLKYSYSKALHAAMFAHCLASLRSQPNPVEEAIAGLLQNIGEMALWARKPGTMKALAEGARRPEEVDFNSWRQFGTCPSDLGAALARHWSVPEKVIQAQHFSQSFEPEAQIPLLAASLAGEGLRNCQSKEMAYLMDLAAELTGQDMDIVRAQLHRETSAAARVAWTAGLPYFADRLLWPPGAISKARAAARVSKQKTTLSTPPQANSPQPIRGTTAPRPQTTAMPNPAKAVKPEAKTPLAARPQPPTRPAAAQQPSPPSRQAPPRQTAASLDKAETVQPAADSQKPLTAAPRPASPQKPPRAKKNHPLHEQIDNAIREMQTVLGLERIMFAMLTADHSEIRCRLLAERQKSGLGGFSVPATSTNLFNLLITKPHTLWVNPNNQVKYRPYIPESAVPLIHENDFFLSSVIVNGKAIGIFYADATDSPLDKDKFHLFKKMMERTNSVFKKPKQPAN